MYIPKVCWKKDIDNCRVYAKYNACLECYDGYFVNVHKKCEVNPTAGIKNCEVYAYDKHC